MLKGRADYFLLFTLRIYSRGVIFHTFNFKYSIDIMHVRVNIPSFMMNNFISFNDFRDKNRICYVADNVGRHRTVRLTMLDPIGAENILDSYFYSMYIFAFYFRMPFSV